MKFYKCNTCGQIFLVINDTEVTPTCCNKEMEELVHRNNEIGLNELHIPVINSLFSKVYVRVGDVLHPMKSTHYIKWILLITNKGMQRKELKPGDSPRVSFKLDSDEYVLEVYAYCSLHGLWKVEMNHNKIHCLDLSTYRV